MNKNEKGFGAVGGLVILLIVSLVGVIGYTVYNAQNKSESKSGSSSATSVVNKPNNDAKEAAAKTETKWLLKYTSQNKKFSVYVPDGWKLSSTLNYDTLYAWNSSDIQYKEGAKAEVQTFEGGRDGSSIAFSMWYLDNAEELYLSPDTQKVKSYKTASGVTVDKYVRTQTKEPEEMDIPKGTTEYKYVLNSNNRLIVITHDVLPGEPEQSTLIEKMIETLEFL